MTITTASDSCGAVLDHPRPLAQRGRWAVLTGLAIGLLYAVVFRVSWRVFGETAGLRIIPAAMVWLCDVAWLGAVPLLSAAATIARWRPAEPAPLATQDAARDGMATRGNGTIPTMALIVTLLAVFKLLLWICVPADVASWPTDWRRYFNWAYPRPVFRPLILAPLWGRWAMVLAAGVGRASPNDLDPPGVRGSHVQSPVRVLALFLVPAVLTAVYCGPGGRWMLGALIALAVLAVSYLFSFLSALRFSGHTRGSVAAACFVAETTFLLVYLGAASRIHH